MKSNTLFRLVIVLFCVLAPQGWSQGNDALPALVQVLGSSSDPQFQLDVLKGMTEGLKGRRSVPMPRGWEVVESKLGNSSNAEIRALAQSLGLTFGSTRALSGLRHTVQDNAASSEARHAALAALVRVRDQGLPPILNALLRDPVLRGPAIRALAGFDEPPTPAAILAVYGTLNATEKRDALNTLASRAAFARPLLAAVGSGAIPSSQLTAELVRQLHNLKSPEIDQELIKVWGVARETSADKQKEIERYKQIYRAGGSQPGDAPRGRAIFARTCQQCHTLFDVGAKVGPDLTGSNRSDLDYILQNMVDPNAVIPNDYRTSTVETKDDRIITGIIKQQDANSISIVTANEALVIPRPEIKSVQQNELSMMPEGLLAPFKDQEVRDLIYYLGRPGQVPLPATAEK